MQNRTNTPNGYKQYMHEYYQRHKEQLKAYQKWHYSKYRASD